MVDFVCCWPCLFQKISVLSSSLPYLCTEENRYENISISAGNCISSHSARVFTGILSPYSRCFSTQLEDVRSSCGSRCKQDKDNFMNHLWKLNLEGQMGGNEQVKTSDKKYGSLTEWAYSWSNSEQNKGLFTDSFHMGACGWACRSHRACLYMYVWLCASSKSSSGLHSAARTLLWTAISHQH